MMRWWVNLLPFGLVVWLARRHCEVLPFKGKVVETVRGVLVSKDPTP